MNRGIKINNFYKRYSKFIAGKNAMLTETGEQTGGLTAQHKLQIIKKMIQKYCNVKNPTIIDLGGVYGSMSFFKKELNAKVISVNVAEEQLIDCENKIIADITAKIPIENNAADIITCLDTFEHLIEPDEALKNAKRILKPGGLLIITKPNLASLVNRISLLFGYMPTNYCPTEKRVGTLFGKKQSSWHKTVLTPIALKELLQEYGFKTKKIIGYSYSHNQVIQKINSILPNSLREGICIIAINEGSG